MITSPKITSNNLYCSTLKIVNLKFKNEVGIYAIKVVKQDMNDGITA